MFVFFLLSAGNRIDALELFCGTGGSESLLSDAQVVSCISGHRGMLSPDRKVTFYSPVKLLHDYSCLTVYLFAGPRNPSVIAVLTENPGLKIIKPCTGFYKTYIY